MEQQKQNLGTDKNNRGLNAKFTKNANNKNAPNPSDIQKSIKNKPKKEGE